MRCISAAYVGMSVCPSVTFVDHVKTNKHIFEIFSPSGSRTILVFLYQRRCRYSDGNPPNGCVKCRWGRPKTRFWTNIWLYWTFCVSVLSAYTIPRNVELITGRPARSAAMPVLFLLWSKNGFFAPQGRHVAPINVKFGTGERGWTAPPPSHPRAKFHVYRGKNVGIQPQYCQNFEFWPEICTSGATRLQYFYEILSFCTRL